MNSSTSDACQPDRRKFRRTMDELEQYKIQLSQVKSLLEIETNEELEALQQDLEEAIQLIESQSPSGLLSESDSTRSDHNLKNETSSAINIKQESQVIILDSESDDESDEQVERRDKDEIILLDDQETQLNDYDQLIGESYSVPFVVNGRVQMHEAEVIRIVEIDESGDAKLETRFLYPVNESMRYCSQCEIKNCPFNHGHLVDLSMVKDSLDREDLKLNSRCLFNRNNEYWSKGQIIGKKSNSFTVRSDSSQELFTLQLNEVRLFDFDVHEQQDLYSIKDSEKPSSSRKNFEETYSNSIGLKLLQKQGYQVGQGLGKNQDGIKNPIELSILPANTSLDICMELKEKGHLSTSSDTFTYEKQRTYFKNLILKKNLKKVKRKDDVNDRMFRNLNHTLAIKSKQAASTCAYSRVRSIQNETKNTENMNVDILNIENEIRRIQGEIQHCKKSISLCKEMNPANLKKLNVKLGAKESELHTNELKLKLLKEKKKRMDFDRNIKYF